MSTIKKHFVKFLSPGTFVHEETTKPIDSWCIDTAVEMARGIVERHNAKPFAFSFVTRSRGKDDFNSKETKRSGRYYLGGRVLSLDGVKREMPEEEILQANMRCNGWDKIVVNDNSWRICQPLWKDDVVLDVKL